MVKKQYNSLEELEEEMNERKISQETYYQEIIRRVTIYILLARMFIDHCKRINKKYDEITQNIKDFEGSSEAKHIKVLRDYAAHSNLPISIISFSTNYSKRGEFNKNRVEIYKRDLLHNNTPKGKDKQIINSWEGECLNVSKEIKKINCSISDAIFQITQTILKNRLDIETIKECKNDKELWEKKLLPAHVDGIFTAKENDHRNRMTLTANELEYGMNALLNLDL